MIKSFTSKMTSKKGGEMMKNVVLAIALLAICTSASFAATATYDVYAGWNMVSAPLVPINPDPMNVFGAVNIVGNLSGYDATSQGGYTYDDLDPAAFGNILLGDGFWLLCDAGATISYEGLEDGVPATAGGTPTDMWISLPGNTLDGVDEGGWHQIGNPFNHGVLATKSNPGDGILLTDGVQVLTWQQAADAGWCESVMTGYDGVGQGGFTFGYDLADTDTMTAGSGYMFLTKKDNLAMIVPGS